MKTRTILVVLSMLSPFLLPGQAESLSILLTNEEGWDTPGIQTMKEALMTAGHEVTLVAPSSDRSRSGTSFMEGPVSVTEERPNEYAVDAPPATCVVLGFSLIGHAPDLVISGTHNQPILGSTALHSGTVGAALTAIDPQLTGDSVPAMTFSTGFSRAGRITLHGADLFGYDWRERRLDPTGSPY